MSLNKTLDRLFDEIRREAKRNPDFADRLDAVLQRHDSRRDVPDEVLEDAAHDVTPPPRAGEVRAERGEGEVAKAKRRNAPLSQPAAQSGSSPAGGGASQAATPALNPAGVYKKDGEDALTAALVSLDSASLLALVSEHNLDPADETPGMGEAELVAHIVAQAKRRAERDEKMFDY